MKRKRWGGAGFEVSPELHSRAGEMVQSLKVSAAFCRGPLFSSQHTRAAWFQGI